MERVGLFPSDLLSDFAPPPPLLYRCLGIVGLARRLRPVTALPAISLITEAVTNEWALYDSVSMNIRSNDDTQR